MFQHPKCRFFPESLVLCDAGDLKSPILLGSTLIATMGESASLRPVLPCQANSIAGNESFAAHVAPDGWFRFFETNRGLV